QNVLYADGHVQFQNNPFVGIDRDNIYTFGTTDPEVKSLGIVGSPTGPKDSVLLPVAPLRNRTSGMTNGTLIIVTSALAAIAAIVLLFYIRRLALTARASSKTSVPHGPIGMP